jgi:oligopeptide/dipeptide ABC transporter ATP-binding protein
MTLLQATDLTRSFRLPGPLFGRPRLLHAVAGVSLSIAAGEALGLVGESGSGKTTLGRLLVGLLPPSSGSITFNGAPLTGPHRLIQMVFQDSAAALNPRRPVGQSVMLPLRWNRRLAAAAADTEARALFARVGLAPENFFARLPNALSGGQRQRVGIARALASSPSLLIADEPVSALDVSVRAQILRLFAELAAEHALASLFITHDLGVVRAVTQRVAVLYRGRIVELGPTAQVMDTPRHPYTQALRAATPIPDPERPRLAPPRPPEAQDLPGCPFRARCPVAVERCAIAPALREIVPGHWAACHLAQPSDGAEGAISPGSRPR